MKKIRKIILVLCILFASCENESFELSVEKIDVNSELYSDLKAISEASPENSEVVCLTFIYPFNVYLYNNNNEITESILIGNNREFVSLLGGMEDESAIGLSYPISGTTDDGTLNINNNLELKEAIEACIENQIISYCNSLLESDCIWNIESISPENQYNDSKFDFYSDGTGIFYHDGNAYRTSWIPFYIEEQLHLNIHLEENSDIGENWNFDWEATIIDENTIQIDNQEHSFIIQKNCTIENNCDYVEFRECISENGSETQFVFDNYIDCIISFRETTEIPDLQLSFYETIDNVEQQINPLPTSGYNTSMNPQIIFVLINNTVTGTSEITRIVLLKESCDDN
ncbi:hypothetical protein [uncultured Aquimarina sp.]|uniref:hypothetical protein n=1 Tax=uncultured Aquimarina sp. TaxID=575652 RepID=UPI00262DBF8E|nr:hypothetical protein [uncultured Aquimarina sp.]